MNPQALLLQDFYPHCHDEMVVPMEENAQKSSSFCYAEAVENRIKSLFSEIQKTRDEQAAFKDSWLFYIFGKHRKVTVSMAMASAVPGFVTTTLSALGKLSPAMEIRLCVASCLWAILQTWLTKAGCDAVDDKRGKFLVSIADNITMLEQVKYTVDLPFFVGTFRRVYEEFEKDPKEEKIYEIFRTFEAVGSLLKILSVNISNKADSPIAGHSDLGKLILMDQISEKLKGSELAGKWQHLIALPDSHLWNKCGVELWESLGLENPQAEAYAIFIKNRSHLKTVCLANETAAVVLTFLKEKVC